MDPKASIEAMLDRAREIIRAIDAGEEGGMRMQDLAGELAEYAIALHEWRTNGGFDPYLRTDGDTPTPAQGIALARVMRDFHSNGARVTAKTFDLPEGYLAVTLYDPQDRGPDFECGIAPNGDVSS